MKTKTDWRSEFYSNGDSSLTVGDVAPFLRRGKELVWNFQSENGECVRRVLENFQTELYRWFRKEKRWKN